nr:MAG TPA: hypothetical protein [Caudoviricetes sp.]
MRRTPPRHCQRGGVPHIGKERAGDMLRVHARRLPTSDRLD